MAMRPDRKHMTLTLPVDVIDRLKREATERRTLPSVVARALLSHGLDTLDATEADGHAAVADLVDHEAAAESERRSKAGKKGMATRWSTGADGADIK